ncbi:MAG TPA: alpha/beta hydrolase [Caulobacter sp.]|nr:alpha/beta hydrolase [Caulobacter sp.]
MSQTVTILFVPGLRGHVADHWQTLMAPRFPRSATVPPLEVDGLSCDARVANLDAALAALAGPVVLVAHSAGVLITAHWAQTRFRRDVPWSIRGALLATPADLERPLPEGYPSMDVLQANRWLPVPRGRLPFPTLLATSRNDPLGDVARVTELGLAWGSEIVDLGAVGHLNPAAGFGDWSAGDVLVDRLLVD